MTPDDEQPFATAGFTRSEPGRDRGRARTRISMFPDAGLFPGFGLPLTPPVAGPAARD
jgi:hypothetical protein